jgi:hypothetical protein
MLTANLYKFLMKRHSNFHNKNTYFNTKLTFLTAFTFCADFSR